jgi:hypothetical protein
MIALNTQGHAGILQYWESGQTLKDDGKNEPARLHGKDYRWRGFWRATQFSLLSSFRIGWRDINPGYWLAWVEGKEYTLRATGWARTVADIQSLISIYLIALSVLTYFGRPFES